MIPTALCWQPGRTRGKRTKDPFQVDVSRDDEGGWNFPGGAVVKNPPANAGDMGLSPGPGRSHMSRSN